MKIFLDMDGVCTNFDLGCQKVFNWPMRPREPKQDVRGFLKISNKEFWNEIDKHGEDFWVDLEEEAWFRDLLQIVEQYDKNWKFLTSPSLSHYAASGKIQWMQNRFGKWFRNYHITPAGNKCDLAKRDCVLIDDNEKNVKEFKENGGYAILFPRFWNRNYIIESKKLQHVKEQLDLISKYI